ncbi:MAG: FlgD immunoglobulin-like domain containing protein [Chloroflexia bacterium]
MHAAIHDDELGNVWLSIHNSKGVEVRSFVKTVRNAGTYTQSWDGKLAAGASAPSGTYKWYVFLTDAGGNRAQRFPSSATIIKK